MKDRVPTYPGRVKLTPVSGQADTYDLTRADAPTEAGTPINKATLLKDATASALGLSAAATPDDGFQVVADLKKDKGLVKDLSGTFGQVITDESIVPGVGLSPNWYSDDAFVETNRFIAWIGGGGYLNRLDKRTGENRATDIAINYLSALANDQVWVATTGGNLMLVNLSTLAVLKTYTLGITVHRLAAISSTTVLVESSDKIYLKVNGAGTSNIDGSLNCGWTYRSGSIYIVSQVSSGSASLLRATISGSTVSLKESITLVSGSNVSARPLFLPDAMYIVMAKPQDNSRPYYTTCYIGKYLYSSIASPVWSVSQRFDISGATAWLFYDGSYLYMQRKGTETAHQYNMSGTLVATLSTAQGPTTLANQMQSQHTRHGDFVAIAQPWFGAKSIITTNAAAPVYGLDTYANRAVTIRHEASGLNLSVRTYSSDGFLFGICDSKRTAWSHAKAKSVMGVLEGGSG